MRHRLWGILGGLGPLASAEFVKTIYEISSARAEQEAPAVILLSDPSFPDRTLALETNALQTLVQPLTRSLTRLQALEVTDIVICCVTIHAVLPSMSPELRSRVVSLIDVIVSAAAATNEKHLLVSTKGSRLSRVFENHPLWRDLHERIVFPDEKDQAALHDLIYEAKRGEHGPAYANRVIRIVRKYNVKSFIAGCTEMHILHRYLRQRNQTECGCIDPLHILALQIAGTSTPKRAAS
jgi:aspartate racemase